MVVDFIIFDELRQGRAKGVNALWVVCTVQVCLEGACWKSLGGYLAVLEMA